MSHAVLQIARGASRSLGFALALQVPDSRYVVAAKRYTLLRDMLQIGNRIGNSRGASIFNGGASDVGRQ